MTMQSLIGKELAKAYNAFDLQEIKDYADKAAELCLSYADDTASGEAASLLYSDERTFRNLSQHLQIVLDAIKSSSGERH